MLLLSVSQIVRQFDAAPVLNGVTFEVNSGDKLGLVGPNGAGKTTLFRILAGLDEPDSGQVQQPAGLRVGMLEQSTEFSADRTLIDEARAGLAPLYALQDEALDVAAKIAAADDDTQRERLQRRYDVVQLHLQRLQAYNI
ncbi:MAG: ATP-binding cassette domain-containing protein, partial [Planctomycetota bacterium]|nr:ATP-binding cassette domain-containing protein [Planctomycetota bacterium]